MTDASSASRPAAMRSLAATVERVTALAAKAGRRLEEVLDPSTLHLASGVPVDVIEALLQGRPAGEPDIQVRFLQRLELLRRTHLDENGRRYSQAAIADATGILRQTINAVFLNKQKPSMSHCSRLEQFFDRPSGWLQSEDVEALDNALRLEETSLLKEYANRETHIFEHYGVERIALRAALLPDKAQQKVVDWLDGLLQDLTKDPAPPGE